MSSASFSYYVFYFYTHNFKRFHGTKLRLFAFYFKMKRTQNFSFGEFHHKNTLLLLSFFSFLLLFELEVLDENISLKNHRNHF